MTVTRFTPENAIIGYGDMDTGIYTTYLHDQHYNFDSYQTAGNHLHTYHNAITHDSLHFDSTDISAVLNEHHPEWKDIVSDGSPTSLHLHAQSDSEFCYDDYESIEQYSGHYEGSFHIENIGHNPSAPVSEPFAPFALLIGLAGYIGIRRHKK